ncbi:PREDICTED: uncharacterized protein LOC109173401 [Ipomoea nil]|uniref:uncharacterized protein LOC109173401 n=1 Tax=Ipomoea nil TaxID=35883 RepID=UPI0009017916|nr:PREDICTED: uncharacterized protein LOC109173401 [Ipomoea nil]
MVVNETNEVVEPELSTSSSSSESDNSEDEKGLLCLFIQEESDDNLCLMAKDDEVVFQSSSSTQVESCSESEETCVDTDMKLMGDFKKQPLDTIRAHLYRNGVDGTYVSWIWHGEKATLNNSIDDTDHLKGEEHKLVDENPIDMVNDAYDEYVKDPNKFSKLLEDAEKPLYAGCTTFTKLSAVVKLYNLKVKYSWSDASFTDLLDLFAKMLPTDNVLPSSLYEAKRSLVALGMDYEKIHVCPNDCILYWKENANCTNCPTCGTSRWKIGKNSKISIGVPAKRKFMMLTLLISGPKQPGNDIDVYLAPLIDDLKALWEEGIEAYYAYRQERFILKAVLLWTINDFPTYGNLSSCTVKGYHACPICGENTYAKRLKHSKKMTFTRHRRFLCKTHPYRRQKKAFDGKKEFDLAPKPLSGYDVLKTVEGINCCWEKNSGKLNAKRKNSESCWKKKSIFFELEYWKHLHVWYVLDVMHIEKNVCESIIGILLDIPGKTKGGDAILVGPIFSSHSD